MGPHACTHNETDNNGRKVRHLPSPVPAPWEPPFVAFQLATAAITDDADQFLRDSSSITLLRLDE